MSLKINSVLPKQQPTAKYHPTNKQKPVDTAKQNDQAINRLAVRFNGDDETKPAKKTVNDFYQKVLQEQPLNEKDKDKKIKIPLNLSKNATLEDYRLATDKAILQKAGYSMLNKDEIETARGLIGLKDNFNLKNLKDLDKANKLVVTTNQYFVEKAKIAGQAVLQYQEYKAKESDAAIEHGKNYVNDAMGGFVQPIVNAPVNIINGLSEPFRAGEKMLFGTQNMPVIPRMEVAERSEYWNKDGRMYANKAAEITATITFGGATGSKALATQGGRILLGTEASYNVAAGIFGKDVTQPDANGNPRQMGSIERTLRVTGGIFGARQVVKAEVNTPSSLVNKLDDVFKPKPPATEAITPEGLRVKVASTENVKGGNVFESKANGFPNQRIPSKDGSWNGKVGESGWLSNKPEVIAVTKGKPVPYKNGFPVFDKWKVGEIKLPKMKGNHTTDFDDADELFAVQQKWYKPNGTPDTARVAKLRTDNNLTWHHHEDMTTMQLVPKNLNNEIPHTGGVSFIKRANKK
jgi:DNase/tRNase domain of colicin-like bacteriocin